MVIQAAAEIQHDVDQGEPQQVLGLKPSPGRLFKYSNGLRLSILNELNYSSVLSADRFSKDLLCELCKLAARLQMGELKVGNALSDKILATAFFEPSTRTRLSFESAMLQLGGKTISVAEAATTGIAKGESLVDIGQMFNSYANAVVVRHTQQEAIQELSTYLRIPLINGGNGSDEHPTQALADWYAILKWKPEIGFKTLDNSEKLNLGIVGTPGSMRTVKSFILLALLFKENIKKITIISELADPLGSEVQDFVNKSPIPIQVIHDLQKVVSNLDVIYMNGIAWLGDGYRTLGRRFRLDKESKLKPGAVILHPLARKEELSFTLDDTEHNLYFNQADGAVYIRQALLLSLFKRLDLVPEGLAGKQG